MIAAKFDSPHAIVMTDLDSGRERNTLALSLSAAVVRTTQPVGSKIVNSVALSLSAFLDETVAQFPHCHMDDSEIPGRRSPPFKDGAPCQSVGGAWNTPGGDRDS